MKGDAHGGCRAGVSFYIVWLATSNKNYAELRAVDAAFVSACALADWRLGVSQMYARQMAASLVVQNESVKKHKKNRDLPGFAISEESRASWLRFDSTACKKIWQPEANCCCSGVFSCARKSAFVSLALVSWRCDVNGAGFRPPKQGLNFGVAMWHGICDNGLRNVR